MIEINNLISRADYGFLKKVAKIVLNKKKFDLSIALVNPGKIKELNRRYRKQNKVTDVLSFIYDDSGEIAICLKQVKENAKKFGLPFKTELAKVLIHSVLHLTGYDHKSQKQAKIMEKRENHYLNLWLKRK